MVVMSVLEGLMKGMDWVFQEQNDDGGWSDEPGKVTSHSEASGHVLCALIQIFGIHLKQIEKALVWVEREFVGPTSGRPGYWPRDVTRGLPNTAAGLLCCYNLLRAEELGRDLKIVKLEHLIDTGIATANNLLLESSEIKERPIWLHHSVSLLLSLKCFDDELRDIWIQTIESTMMKKSSWEASVDNAAYAQAILGLLHCEKSSRELIRDAVEYLVRMSRREVQLIYWPCIDGLPGGEFEKTRWVLWALEECWNRQIITEEVFKDTIEGGISWILDKQNDKGYWERSDGRMFGPNYCGYALLNLWKWVQINQDISQECLVFFAETICDAKVSLPELKQLKDKEETLTSERDKLRDRLTGLEKKLHSYKLTTYTLILIMVVGSVLILVWNIPRVWTFVDMHRKELSIISAIIAILSAFIGGIMGASKLLKRKKKKSNSKFV
jgi:hypothetical protein